MEDASIFILHRMGDGEIEGGSLPQLGLHPDLAAVFFYQPSGDGKPQTCPTMFACFDLVKFVKDLFNLILWNTNPSVSNLMEDIIILLAGDDLDLTSIRSKFDGVGEEVEEDIMKPIFVGEDVKVFGYVELDGDILILWLDFIDITFDDFREIERLSREVETARSEPGQIQHPIHSRLDSVGIPLDGEEVGF